MTPPGCGGVTGAGTEDWPTLFRGEALEADEGATAGLVAVDGVSCEDALGQTGKGRVCAVASLGLSWEWGDTVLAAVEMLAETDRFVAGLGA